MALKLPDVAAFKATPLWQRVFLLALPSIAVIGLFFQFVESPRQETLNRLSGEIKTLDNEINTNKAKVKNLAELKRATAELERQLAKNKEQLPPEDEATNLLKQLSDLGVRIGLDFKVWKQNPRIEDSSKLFVRLPVEVEMSGGYHTLALFFDRIGKLPRIINVAKLRMGSGKMERGRFTIQTSFQLTAFAASSAPVAVVPATGKPEAAAKPAGK